MCQSKCLLNEALVLINPSATPKAETTHSLSSGSRWCMGSCMKRAVSGCDFMNTTWLAALLVAVITHLCKAANQCFRGGTCANTPHTRNMPKGHLGIFDILCCPQFDTRLINNHWTSVHSARPTVQVLKPDNRSWQSQSPGSDACSQCLES